MLIGGVATWLGSSRPRCVCLLLCSPLLLPLLLAIFPIICVGALCFKYYGRRWRKLPESLLDEDGLGRCEEGRYGGRGGAEEEEAKRQDEECLLERYLEDQLLLIRFDYERENGNGDVKGDFQFPEIDDTTIPLLDNMGVEFHAEEFQRMTRKKVTLSFIANDTSRKATFKKRKKGFIKKLTELSTLCGIEACAMIYSPFETLPETWPSPSGVHRVLARFRGLSEMDQSRKMVNLESFIRQRIAKANDQLKKVIKENREKEMTRVMFDCLTGNSLHGLTLLDLQDLGWVIDQHLNDIERRDDFLTNTVAQNENQAQPVMPPPLMEGGEEMLPVYGGQSTEIIEGIQGSQPLNPETMNSSQDPGFNVDDMILPFEDANNSNVWSPFWP